MILNSFRFLLKHCIFRFFKKFVQEIFQVLEGLIRSVFRKFNLFLGALLCMIFISRFLLHNRIFPGLYPVILKFPNFNSLIAPIKALFTLHLTSMLIKLSGQNI